MKCRLWHCQTGDALEVLEDIAMRTWDFDASYPKLLALTKHVYHFQRYLERNHHTIVNYGERWRAGKVVSTAFVESAVNVVLDKRFSKKQQMQWTPKGAHLLLQTRTRVINDELADTFKAWYPDFQAQGPSLAA